MFRLKYKGTFDRCTYYKHDKKAIIEDHYETDGDIFCVADGVTKDLKDTTATKYPNTLEEIENILEKYPNPSGSHLAAKITCENFIKCISETKKEDINENKIHEIVKNINDDVIEINKNRKINYLDEDAHVCEASGGVIVNNKLYAFSIGDCFITLLDNNYNVIFTTHANENFINYTKQEFEDLNFDWDNNEYRYMLRRFFRNNPSLKNNGEDISYGALGEENADYYINTYCLDLDNVQYICAYSDGYEPNFSSLESRKEVIEDIKNTKYDGNEKTIIIYENIQ